MILKLYLECEWKNRREDTNSTLIYHSSCNWVRYYSKIKRGLDVPTHCPICKTVIKFVHDGNPYRYIKL